MNKKILGIIAASVAALGSAIFAAPAHAVKQDVDVNVTIQPGIYLRTFKTINLQITQGDLGALQESDFNTGGSDTTDGSGTLMRTQPRIGAGSNTEVTKNVKELFAVWSNGNKPINVTVTPKVNDTGNNLTVLASSDTTSTDKVILKSVTVNNGSGTPTARVPVVGGVDLVFDTSEAGAGSYTGTGLLTVEALAQL
ncbi:hypothetical protein NIES2101_35595 [Calothrix sp. HK-06]|nr:hypothetical protein NIES2101_35595 [Calothrix sp. HK-06]